MLKLEAIKIGDSLPAPLLTLIVGPSEETKEVGRTKQELAGQHNLRYRFWDQLLKLASNQITLHANVSPSAGNWIGTGAGKSGLGYNYVVRQRDVAVELYIDRGNERDTENLQIFQELQKHKDVIEQSFGQPLEWDHKEGRRSCRIRKILSIGGYRDEDRWPEIHQ